MSVYGTRGPGADEPGAGLHLSARGSARRIWTGPLRAFVRRRRGPIEHSMLLEDQKVEGKGAEALLDDIVRETNPRLFWD